MPRRRPAPEAPSHLSERSRELWREIVPRRAKSPERLTMLTVALEALDRLDQCRALLADEPLVSQDDDSKMPHAHPALRLEREARQTFTRLWIALGLDWWQELDRDDV